MRTLLVGLRALTFMSGFVFFWGWIALGLRPMDRLVGGLPQWTEVPGAALMAVGGSLALWCAGAFVALGRGTPAPFDAPRQFVAAGPYRYVRNPMYLGGFAVLIGFGLYLHSGAILVLAPPWFLAAHLFVVGYEEPTLREKFGDTYEKYCKAVARWRPGSPLQDRRLG